MQRLEARALFEPPPFQPSKLQVSFALGVSSESPVVPPQGSRRYTLTHNDITGELRLSIGTEYNVEQISGFYTRLLRDEVTAEWRQDSREKGAGGRRGLHVFCHVSGEERWLAPPLLRNYIFRREMPLVLECLVYAERELLERQPHLARAKVYVHFQSSVDQLDSTECWGVLGERSTWRGVPTSILKKLFFGAAGLAVQEQALSSYFDASRDSSSRDSLASTSSISLGSLDQGSEDEGEREGPAGQAGGDGTGQFGCLSPKALAALGLPMATLRFEEPASNSNSSSRPSGTLSRDHPSNRYGGGSIRRDPISQDRGVKGLAGRDEVDEEGTSDGYLSLSPPEDVMVASSSDGIMAIQDALGSARPHLTIAHVSPCVSGRALVGRI